VDPTRKENGEAAFTEFLDDKPKVDIVNSNAALTRVMGSLSAINPEVFLSGVSKILIASFNVAQAFARYGKLDGVAVNVSSGVAHLNDVDFFIYYSVSKIAGFRAWACMAFTNPNLSGYHVQPGVLDMSMSRGARTNESIGLEDHDKWSNIRSIGCEYGKNTDLF
jgi:NAD(P)-dependent dehydrogenase (short-subunit alcohol dehydrogenase family)